MLLTLNLTGLAAVSPAGLYANPVKFLFLLLFTGGWLWLVPRVNADAIRANAKRELWTGLTLGAGALGFLLWLFIPMYAIGLAVFVLVLVSVLAAYVVHRNSLVDPSDRILTADWFASFKGGGRSKKALKVETRLRVYGHDGHPVILTEGEVTDRDIVRAYNASQRFLYDLARIRAQESDIRPGGEMTRVLFVIDGVGSEGAALEPNEAELMIRFLKLKAGIPMDSQEKVQRGRMSIDMADSKIELEILTAAGEQGHHRMQVRVLSELVQTNLDSLGLTGKTMSAVQELVSEPGLLLVASPPKTGLTSTMYSILRKQDAFMRLITTIEQNPARDLENITQNVYAEPAQRPELLGTILRRDPDLLMVDDFSDPKTASMLCQYAGEKTVITGTRGSDVFQALARWVQAVGNANAAMANLKGVLCQTLVRSLCQGCREAYRPDAALLKKLRLPSDRIDVFYRPPTPPPAGSQAKEKYEPCQNCQAVGYHGRTGVFEFLPITDEIRELVCSNAGVTALRNAARQAKVLTLQDQAILKVVAGETSLQEVLRVMQSGQKKA